MLTRNILLASLLAALCGCQPEIPKEFVGKADVWQLAEKSGCFMCHKAGKNLLGPAWGNVSERYRNNPDAEAHLMDRVRNGSRGAWIERDMPAYSEDVLSTENRKILVRFILSLQ